MMDLPKVRGRLQEKVALAPLTWFKVGGQADYFFKPADLEDLQDFLKNKPADLPIFVLGAGSNVIIRDGGFKGVVIKLGREFAKISADDKTLTVGAACLDVTVAQEAAAYGIAGLEFLVGIPGSIGGALRMNAGAYASEMKDVLISCRALDTQGKLHEFSLADMQYSYRHSDLPHDLIFIDAKLQGHAGEVTAIQAAMDKIKNAREESQPIRTKTGGSTFKNPLPHKAWELVDQAGMRGAKIGDAQISEKHCNFMINIGAATAKDIEELGEKVRQKVLEKSGISLEWEIERIGQP